MLIPTTLCQDGTLRKGHNTRYPRGGGGYFAHRFVDQGLVWVIAEGLVLEHYLAFVIVPRRHYWPLRGTGRATQFIPLPWGYHIPRAIPSGGLRVLVRASAESRWCGRGWWRQGPSTRHLAWAITIGYPPAWNCSTFLFHCRASAF